MARQYELGDADGGRQSEIVDPVDLPAITHLGDFAELATRAA